MKSFKDMKDSPIKRLIERELREFANDIEEHLSPPIDTRILMDIDYQMRLRGIYPKPKGLLTYGLGEPTKYHHYK